MVVPGLLRAVPVVSKVRVAQEVWVPLAVVRQELQTRVVPAKTETV